MASVATQKPKNKKAIPIIARISNRTATPASHAVIDIGFDREMLLASSGNYQSLEQFADTSWRRAKPTLVRDSQLLISSRMHARLTEWSSKARG
ncbi:hypothetical protein ACVIHH_008005 [Bradyrhizobium sp. USDA 4518]